MNSANPARSGRLQRAIKLLSSGKELSTAEIVTGAQVMAVSAVVSELRDRGHTIACQRRGDLWFYKMDISTPAICQAVGI